MSYKCPSTKEEYWDTVTAHWDSIANILGMFLTEKECVTAEAMKLDQDPDIVRLFNKAWWQAPDNRSIHSIPGWHVFCDLCSEEWVLHEDEDHP
jgi:hypothetical protein